MKKYGKAIFLVLLFVMVLIPIGGCATQPSEAYPVGIVIDVDKSGLDISLYRGDYFIDIVVPRSEVSDLLTPSPKQSPYYPDALYVSAYADRDNEWVSVSLYLEDTGRYIENDERTIFYADYTNAEDIPFSQYKVAVYYSDEEPIVSSSTFETSDSAMNDRPMGYKTVYYASSQTFESQYYVPETYPGGVDFGGLVYFIIVVFVVLIFVFVLMEGLIYLIARQGWTAVLISLVVNACVFLITVLQVIGVYGKYNMVLMILGMILVPGIYAIKILILRKHAYSVFKVSILISLVYYAIYFFYTAMFMA